MAPVRAALLSLLAFGFLALSAPAQPAYAFGCVPTLYNCMCTYIFPCPVKDGAVGGMTGTIGTSAKEATKTIGDLGGRYDDKSSALSAGDIGKANLTQTTQMLRTILRGANNQNNVPGGVAAPQLRLPERELNGDKDRPVPALVGKGSGPSPVEAYSEARRRVTGNAMSAKPLTPAEENALRTRLQDAARIDNASGLARAWGVQAGLQESFSTANLEKMVDGARTLAEDVRVNAYLKGAVHGRQEEINELMNLWVAQQGAEKTKSAHELVGNPAADMPAYQTPAQVAQRLDLARQVVQTASRADQATDSTREAHNALTSIQDLSKRRQEMLPYVQQHEDRKNHQYLAEDSLQSTLGVLYENPTQAMALLRQDLKQDNSTYATPNRFRSASGLAMQIDQELVAQRPTTRYGRRRAAPPCTQSGPDAAPCIPYTTALVMPGTTVGNTATIDRYYASNEYDGYKIDRRVAMPTGGDNGGGTVEPESATYVLMQYQLEARKRQDWWGEARRGDGKVEGSMSAPLWNELTTKSPECLVGPLPPTQANLRARPELFDINPDCAHRTWAANGQPIENTHLGGMDRTLFSINQSFDSYRAQYKGRPEILSLMGQANQIYSSTNYGQQATGLGMLDIAQQAKAGLGILGAVQKDDKNNQYIEWDGRTTGAIP